MRPRRAPSTIGTACNILEIHHRAPGNRSLAGKRSPSSTKQGRKPAIQGSAQGSAPPVPIVLPNASSHPSRSLAGKFGTTLAVVGLLSVHLALAERSLVLENPTVDEVVHLPAGVTYWQKGTFRLYHHNPPLVRMIAALPVIWANPVMAPVYEQESWTRPDPSPTSFSQTFAYFNATRYFDLFQLARMVMPLFSILGGLVVFAWSRRLHGSLGGLLSLCLWVFCPEHTGALPADHHGPWFNVPGGGGDLRVLALLAAAHHGRGHWRPGSCSAWPSSPSSACWCSMPSGRFSGWSG